MTFCYRVRACKRANVSSFTDPRGETEYMSVETVRRRGRPSWKPRPAVIALPRRLASFKFTLALRPSAHVARSECPLDLAGSMSHAILLLLLQSRGGTLQTRCDERLAVINRELSHYVDLH